MLASDLQRKLAVEARRLEVVDACDLRRDRALGWPIAAAPPGNPVLAVVREDSFAKGGVERGPAERGKALLLTRRVVAAARNPRRVLFA